MNAGHLLQRFLLLFLAAFLCACASQPQETTSQPQRSFPELHGRTGSGKGIVDVRDPLEPFNRSMYNFNTQFDRWVFLPVVHGYERVMPDMAEQGVTNFFNNLSEVRNTMNNLLQGEWCDTGVSVSRFALNTTVGVLGVWDPATELGFNEREEDFGQTLGRWGVGRGAYLVLPFFGPSTLRDAGGLAVDAVAYDAADLLDTRGDANKDGVRVAHDALRAIDTRKNTRFRYYETGSAFEYELVRYAYIRMRDIQVEK